MYLNKSQLDGSSGQSSEFSNGSKFNLDLANYEKYPAFSKVRDFLLASRAFSLFRSNLRDFVHPTFKSKLFQEVERWQEWNQSIESDILPLTMYTALRLRTLIVELADVAPRQIQANYGIDIGLLDGMKNLIENRTGTSWDWWPLQRPLSILAPDHARISWICACGERRWEDVPRRFATQLTRIHEAMPLPPTQATSDEPSEQETTSPTIPTTETRDPGKRQSGLRTPPPQISRETTLTPLSPPETQLPSGSASHNTASTSANVKSSKRVLLGVATSQDLGLAQMHVQNYRDDDFFRELKKRYNGLRGLLRRTMSIWVYSYCDFAKFEKIDENEFVLLGPGIPEAGNLAYEYNPRPMEIIPPVSPHEFRRRYYACHKRCSTTSGNILCILGIRQCRRPCKRSQEALGRIPKRIWVLEEGGDARETFWGLHAREEISFFRVATYHFLILLPPFVFWFLWLFWWGHSGDLQNASVPFMGALGVISLFWFPLIQR